jgi:hypothetical protein
MTPRARAVRAAIAVVALGAVAGLGALVVHTTQGRAALPAAGVPGVTSTPQGGPCLDEQQARVVWTDVTQRLDALVLHPDLSRVGEVAQGTAAQDIRQYLQQNLLDKHLTEREKERLDEITVVQRGCEGRPLTVRVTETLVQDDYLAPDGHVDHRDPGVGDTHHLVESYVRSGNTWKVIAIATVEQTPDPGGSFV